MTSMSLVSSSASGTRLGLETVGSVNIYQDKSAGYFEVQTVTVFVLQRSGRFLWLESSGKASRGGWGLSQHFQGGIWMGKDGGKGALDRETEQRYSGRRSLSRGTRGMDALP